MDIKNGRTQNSIRYHEKIENYVENLKILQKIKYFEKLKILKNIENSKFLTKIENVAKKIWKNKKLVENMKMLKIIEKLSWKC